MGPPEHLKFWDTYHPTDDMPVNETYIVFTTLHNNNKISFSYRYQWLYRVSPAQKAERSIFVTLKFENVHWRSQDISTGRQKRAWQGSEATKWGEGALPREGDFFFYSCMKTEFSCILNAFTRGSLCSDIDKFPVLLIFWHPDQREGEGDPLVPS